MSQNVQTIDITPMWSGILPILLTLLQSRERESRELAMEELTRMAKLADKQVALVKAGVV